MLIGIMSDSHDDMQQIRRAVEFFNEKRVAHVIHAGDHVSPFTFEALGLLAAPFTGVYGNNDGDKVLLKEKSGGNIKVQPYAMMLGGKRFVVVHEPTAVDALADSGHYDVVIFGHTHIPVVRKHKEALVVNPGKTARLHKGGSTVALLDIQTVNAEIVDIS